LTGLGSEAEAEALRISLTEGLTGESGCFARGVPSPDSACPSLLGCAWVIFSRGRPFPEAITIPETCPSLLIRTSRTVPRALPSLSLTLRPINREARYWALKPGPAVDIGDVTDAGALWAFVPRTAVDPGRL
jgi:hypothetical protein